MPDPALVFLHGLESGPHGTQVQALTAACGPVFAPDTEGLLDPWERLARIEVLTADERDDGHRRSASLDVMLDQARALLTAPTAVPHPGG